METALKEQIKRRNELVEKLLMASVNGGNNGSIIQEICNDLSGTISKAITPVNDVTAAFILTMLKGYVRTISEKFPEAAEFSVKLAESGKSVVFSMPIKEEE